MDAAVRIVIADDHSVVLAGVRAMLEAERPRMQVVGEAASGGMLLELLARSPDCDVLVTDFSMPSPQQRDCDGIALLQTLRRRYPQLRIVVLTMIENAALMQAMLDTGIHGLVDKVSSLRELRQAVRSAAAGRRHISREVRGLLRQELAGESRSRLSVHEAEVVRLFARGSTVSEIAERLSRSVKTISRQKNDAMRKLGIDNHSQLYAYAREHGLNP